MVIATDSGNDDLSRLVERSHAGDAEARRRLVGEIEGVVRAAARRAVRDPHDLEDLTQNIFLAVFRGLSTYRGEAHFRTWLGIVARNEGRKFLRTQMRREHPIRDAERDPERLAARPGPDPLQARRLVRALRKLPEGDREALERVVFDGLTYSAAGAALGCSAAAIRGRVFRARRALKQMLQDTRG